MLIASSARNLFFGLFVFSLISLAGALYVAFFMTRWEALNREFLRFFRNDLNTWQLIAKAAAICFLLLTLISIADDLYEVYKHKKSRKEE